MASKSKSILPEMPHMGSLIKTEIGNSKLNHSELGRILQVDGIAISRYTLQKSLQCYTVFNLSKALQTNLFLPLSEALNLPKAETLSANELQMQERIKDLEKELEIYKEIVLGRK